MNIIKATLSLPFNSEFLIMESEGRLISLCKGKCVFVWPKKSNMLVQDADMDSI